MNKTISRKNFIKSLTLLSMGGIFSQIPAADNFISNEANQGLVIGSNEGEVYLIGKRQGRITIKADRKKEGIKTMSLLSEDIRPGDGIPVHKHLAEEEFIFIEKGNGKLTFGDKIHEVTQGSMALVPRTVWHGLKNESDEMLRMVFGYSPAGFEDYFRAIGVRPGEQWKKLSNNDWNQINQKFGVVYRG